MTTFANAFLMLWEQMPASLVLNFKFLRRFIRSEGAWIQSTEKLTRLTDRQSVYNCASLSVGLTRRVFPALVLYPA